MSESSWTRLPQKRQRLTLEQLEDRDAPAIMSLGDINTQFNSAGSDFANFVDVNGTLFFTANNTTSGKELWKSDGTASGTMLVKDIRAGTLGSGVSRLTNVNGTLYFIANDGINGSELWRSDGTANGTLLVKDIRSGSSGSDSMYLTNVNGTLFFIADDGINGNELWKSDGTTSGTVLVKDVYAGESGSSLSRLTNVNGTLYFTADDGINGNELWKSDGTLNGTVIVKNIGSGVSGLNPRDLTDVNGILFFRAFDSKYGFELWKSDGTDGGTVLVKDIRIGPSSTYLYNLTAVNSTLFFVVDDGVYGSELWKSDGTASGTGLVKDINFGRFSSNPNELTVADGILYFTANDGSAGLELWKSDGTTNGTVIVNDIRLGSSYPRYLKAINGMIYFVANDGINGAELWKSNGTVSGTVLVKDIVAGAGSSFFSNLTNVNGTLFFTANDGINGYELWKSNATLSGTVLVKDINVGTNGSNPLKLTNVNGTLFFTANDGIHENALWKSNGTASSTVLVKDIVSGPGINPDFRFLTHVNGLLYFSVNDGVNGYELWKSDGTEIGTQIVSNIRFGRYDSDPQHLMNVNGALYFIANNGHYGTELWKISSVGTGAYLVKDIRAGSLPSLPDKLINVNGTLYFIADDGNSGQELWKSDGTQNGTVLVKDIRVGALASDPSDFADVEGILYFTADNGINGQELWKSDGTANGTVLLKDIFVGSSSSEPRNLTNVNGTLFFTVNDGNSGYELWKSDGTTNGTVQVKDIRAGASSSNPRSLMNVNGTLFFTASDGVNGYELWKSDGTAYGTVIVKDIFLATSSSNPSSLTNVNGTLYFTANDGLHGYELWKSDGTSSGTVLVSLEIMEGIGGSDPANLLAIGDQLFFSATTETQGAELWMWKNEAPTDIIILASSIAEGEASGITVGTLSTTDPDHGDRLTYSLVSGSGSTDNGNFTIDGDTLKALASFNFESKNSYAIRVRSTDQGGLSTEKEFTINVTNVNESPTDIALPVSSIAENEATGTSVGTFNTTDPDSGNNFTYSLVSGTGSTDNSSFTIDGSSLKTASSFNFEDKNSYAIRVRSTDQGGLSTEKEFTINITNVDETVNINSTPTTILPVIIRNATTHLGVAVSSLLTHATDAESASTLSLAITGTQGVLGTWQYRSLATNPWVNVPAVSGSNAYLLARTDFVRFLPNRNVTGYAAFKFLAWDGITGTPRTSVDPSATPIAFSTNNELAWVPVGITTPKYNLDGNIPLTATKEDVTSRAAVARNLLGFLPFEFPAKTNLGLAITGTTGNGTWQVLVGRTWQPLGAVSLTSARLLKATDQIRFVPSANWNGEALIHYRAWKVPTTLPLPTTDDITANPSNFSIEPLAASVTVTPVNDAPTIDRSIARVFDANAKSVTELMQGTADIDSTVKGIALTRAVSKNGFWEYRKTTSDVWTRMTGLSTSRGLLLDSLAEIRFTPNVGATVSNGSLDYKAWDNSLPYNSGDRKSTTTTAFSTLAETATFSIGNTAPTFKVGTAPVLPATTTVKKPVSYAVSALLARMTDTPGFLRGIAVTNTTGSGTWDFSLDGGRTWQAIGDVSTNRLLLRSTDRLRFTPTPNTPSTATISFAAWDQTTGAFGDRIVGANDSQSIEELTASLTVA